MISKKIGWPYRLIAAALSLSLIIPSPAYAAREAGLKAVGALGSEQTLAKLRSELRELGIREVETKFAAHRAEVRLTHDELNTFKAYPNRFVDNEGLKLLVPLKSLSQPAEPRTFGSVTLPEQADRTQMRTQEEILKFVAQYFPEVYGMQRFIDVGGSSIDLRALIKLTTAMGINALDFLPSTTIVAGDFPLALKMGLVSEDVRLSDAEIIPAKDVIQYVIDYKKWEEGKIQDKQRTYTVVRKQGVMYTLMENNTLRPFMAEKDGVYEIWNEKGKDRQQKRKAGQVIDKQLGSFAYFMGQIGAFGLRGTFRTLQPVAEAGGLGRSGGSNAMFLAMASALSGAQLTKADMQAEAVEEEGNGEDDKLAILGGYTGGQESGATLLGGASQMIHLTEVKDAAGNYVWPVGTELVVPLAKSLDEVNERMLSHVALVQGGLPFENGSATIKRTAGGINTTWCERAKHPEDTEGIRLHKSKILVAMVAAYGVAHDRWDLVVWSQNEHRRIRNELDKGFYDAALQALEDKKDRPVYADKYLQILRDDPILNKYLEWHIQEKDDHGKPFDLRKVSLYSLTSEPLIEEVTRLVREYTGKPNLQLTDLDSPAGVFIPGAGGTGSPAVVLAQTSELLEYILKNARLDDGTGKRVPLSAFQVENVMQVMGGTGLLQGFLQPKAGKALELNNLPPESSTIREGYAGIFDQDTGTFYLTENPNDIPSAILELPRVKMLSAHPDIQTAYQAQVGSTARSEVRGLDDIKRDVLAVLRASDERSGGTIFRRRFGGTNRADTLAATMNQLTAGQLIEKIGEITKTLDAGTAGFRGPDRQLWATLVNLRQEAVQCLITTEPWQLSLHDFTEVVVKSDDVSIALAKQSPDETLYKVTMNKDQFFEITIRPDQISVWWAVPSEGVRWHYKKAEIPEVTLRHFLDSLTMNVSLVLTHLTARPSPKTPANRSAVRNLQSAIQNLKSERSEVRSATLAQNRSELRRMVAVNPVLRSLPVRQKNGEIRPASDGLRQAFWRIGKVGVAERSEVRNIRLPAPPGWDADYRPSQDRASLYPLGKAAGSSSFQYFLSPLSASPEDVSKAARIFGIENISGSDYKLYWSSEYYRPHYHDSVHHPSWSLIELSSVKALVFVSRKPGGQIIVAGEDEKSVDEMRALNFRGILRHLGHPKLRIQFRKAPYKRFAFKVMSIYNKTEMAPNDELTAAQYVTISGRVRIADLPTHRELFDPPLQGKGRIRPALRAEVRSATLTENPGESFDRLRMVSKVEPLPVISAPDTTTGTLANSLTGTQFVFPQVETSRALQAWGVTGSANPEKSTAVILQINASQLDETAKLLTFTESTAPGAVKVVIAKDPKLQTAVARLNGNFLLAPNAEAALVIARAEIRKRQDAGTFSSRAEVRALVVDALSPDAVLLKKHGIEVVSLTRGMVDRAIELAGITQNILDRVRSELRAAESA